MPSEIEVWIRQAREGDEASMGRLLSSQKRALKLLARIEIGRHIQGKLDASDVVQETFLEAHRSFPRFEGSVEAQFNAWMRTILARTMANTIRRFFGTQARDPRLERRLADDIDRSALSLGGLLADPASTPSQHVARDEQTRLVVEALSRLPDDYESVLVLRHLEGLTFPQIADRMGRSVNSVEKLWLRGLTKLRREFAQPSRNL